MPVLLAPEQRWVCPNCTATDVTHLPADAVASRFHACRGLRGLTAPMVPAGTRCKVEAVERADYTNGDMVTTDGDGRPVMAVETTRDDGNDLAVFAPCATANGEIG
jgi:hypothetical protein